MEIQQRKLTGRQLNQHSPIPGRRRRRGFTLLELLVAIVVISILASFILPAVTGVFGTAKNAAVSNEISQMESAIATFKQKYGIEPPSSIVLCEDGAGWMAKAASKALIQRMWPNFDFTITHDFNSNSSTTDTFTLTGAECLVFFLGGIQSNGALAGFSKNPADPFAAPASGEVREGPFYEFVPTRLKDTPNTVNAPAKVYLDPLGGQTTPYWYLSSYEGRGYKRFGIDGLPGVAGTDDDGDSKIDYADAPTNTIPDADEINWTQSDDEFPSATFAIYQLSSGGVAHKSKSFQIISPGSDGKYGAGGVFDPSNPSLSNSGLTNKDDYDNITNFSGGKLRP